LQPLTEHANDALGNLGSIGHHFVKGLLGDNEMDAYYKLGFSEETEFVCALLISAEYI